MTPTPLRRLNYTIRRGSETANATLLVPAHPDLFDSTIRFALVADAVARFPGWTIVAVKWAKES